MPYVNDEWVPMAETFGLGSMHQVACADYRPSRLDGLRSVKNINGGICRLEKPVNVNPIGFHKPTPKT